MGRRRASFFCNAVSARRGRRRLLHLGRNGGHVAQFLSLPRGMMRSRAIGMQGRFITFVLQPLSLIRPCAIVMANSAHRTGSAGKNRPVRTRIARRLA
ncbi:hypothetical protein BCAR13_50009 [Paraburkholderia caribensis]|nr:hypothetical protein BCAR13_50009 [Paraburkholderia caribensis]